MPRGAASGITQSNALHVHGELNDWGNHPAWRQSDLTPLAQRGSSNSGMPVSSRYGLFFARKTLMAWKMLKRNGRRETRRRCVDRGAEIRPPDAHGDR